jgi:hypothetical protein
VVLAGFLLWRVRTDGQVRPSFGTRACSWQSGVARPVLRVCVCVTVKAGPLCPALRSASSQTIPRPYQSRISKLKVDVRQNSYWTASPAAWYSYPPQGASGATTIWLARILRGNAAMTPETEVRSNAKSSLRHATKTYFGNGPRFRSSGDPPCPRNQHLAPTPAQGIR